MTLISADIAAGPQRSTACKRLNPERGASRALLPATRRRLGCERSIGSGKPDDGSDSRPPLSRARSPQHARSTARCASSSSRTMAFLTVVDLFAAQALLPTLVQRYGVSPAAMGLAVNASTFGMAAAGLAVALFSRHIDRRTGISWSLCSSHHPDDAAGARPQPRRVRRACASCRACSWRRPSV